MLDNSPLPDPSPLLHVPGAVTLAGADDAVPAHYGAPLREMRHLDDGRALVDLSHLGVVSITGADRTTWLNSFTSQLLLDLVPGASAELLILSPTGRIEHHARVLAGADDLLLVTEPGAQKALIAFLDAMRFAARVDVVDRTADIAVLGSTVPLRAIPDVMEHLPADAELAAWQDPWPGVTRGGLAYSPAGPEEERDWIETLVSRTALPALAQLAAGRLAGTLAAEGLRIAAHRPRFGFESDERTIPHEVDWLRTAVHTAKGCYRGQETVAKVLNLGQPPRRLVGLHLDGSEEALPRPGDAVVLGGRKEIGRITSAAHHMDLGPIALALVKRAAPLDAELEVVASAQDASGADRSVRISARQEPIVVPRDHGARPETAPLGRPRG